MFYAYSAQSLLLCFTICITIKTSNIQLQIRKSLIIPPTRVVNDLPAQASSKSTEDIPTERPTSSGGLKCPRGTRRDNHDRDFSTRSSVPIGLVLPRKFSVR